MHDRGADCQEDSLAERWPHLRPFVRGVKCLRLVVMYSSTYHVSAAQGTDCVVNHHLDLFLGRYVGDYDDAFSPNGRDLFQEQLKLFLLRRQIVESHVEPVLSQSECDGSPDALCGACNDCDALLTHGWCGELHDKT